MILALVPMVFAITPPRLDVAREVLDNGLEVIVHANPATPLVSVSLTLPAGASVDPVGRSGLAHLVEHLAFEGTPAVPGNGYDRLLAEVGGASGAWTEHDGITFTVEAPASALARVLYLESDRLAGLAATPEARVNQQSVIDAERGESRRALDARALVARVLWPADHPYARLVIGAPAEVAAIGDTDVARHLAAWWGPRGATLVIAGGVDAEATLDDVRRSFVTVPAQPAAAAPVPSDPGPLATPLQVWAPVDRSLPRVVLAWRTIPIGHADRPALELAAQVLRDALAEEEGLEARAWSGLSGGSFVVAVDDRSPRAALRRMERALVRLVTRGPSVAELDVARAAWQLAELRDLESPRGQAAVLTWCATRFDTPDCVATEWAARDAVDPAAVRAAAARWLAPEARALIVLMPASRGRPRVPGLTMLEEP